MLIHELRFTNMIVSSNIYIKYIKKKLKKCLEIIMQTCKYLIRNRKGEGENLGNPETLPIKM